MRTCVVATALILTAMWSPRVLAQSRVSVEVGGVISAYDVQQSSSVGTARSGLRVMPNSTVPGGSSGTGGNSVAGSTAVAGGTSSVSSGIGAVEIRPTVTLDNGFLMGVGFRVGQAGFGDNSSSLVGADISLGFQHRFGAFMPFLKGMFGLNSYAIAGTSTGYQTDLRLDAVLGSRLYV
ncbi:MAG TPA: hypothetical protein VGL86_06560, partial [Polyangia bacterium]